MDIRDRILASAQNRVRLAGYERLNIRHLAADIGISSTTIHYHFSTRGQLGGEVAARYTSDISHYLYGLLADGIDAPACLARYIDLLRAAFRADDRMCLFGLSARSVTLPAEVRGEIARFATANEDWINLLLTRNGDGTDPAAIRHQARTIFAALDNAHLAARRDADIAAYDRIFDSCRAIAIAPASR